MEKLIINNIEFARKALEFHDIISLFHFPRLKEMCVNYEGGNHEAKLDCRFAGSVDDDGNLALALKVTGCLVLQCQRCMEPFDFRVDINTSFVLVADEALIPEDEASLDKEYLVADSHMSIIDIIEDEVMLMMPLAPKHENEVCANNHQLQDLKKPSAFAVLEKLKTK